MGGRARNGGEEGQGEGTRAHTRACIMCQSTKGGCTFSECNIIALEAGTRMPLNQSRSLGLGLQFHILSPSPLRSSFALSLSLLPSSLCPLLPLSRLVPSFSLVFCCPRVAPSMCLAHLSVSFDVSFSFVHVVPS